MCFPAPCLCHTSRPLTRQDIQLPGNLSAVPADHSFTPALQLPVILVALRPRLLLLAMPDLSTHLVSLTRLAGLSAAAVLPGMPSMAPCHPIFDLQGTRPSLLLCLRYLK